MRRGGGAAAAAGPLPLAGCADVISGRDHPLPLSVQVTHHQRLRRARLLRPFAVCASRALQRAAREAGAMPAKDRREAKAERETTKVVEKSAKQKQQEEVRPCTPAGQHDKRRSRFGAAQRLGRVSAADGAAAPRSWARHAALAGSSDGSRGQTGVS